MSDEAKGDGVQTSDVELVLRRAAEIQAKSAAESTGAIGDRDVVQLAEEIGISRNAAERAIVELRSGALERQREPKTLSERLWSPPEIVCVRTVPGSVDEVDARLREFLTSQHFAIQRHFGDELLWRRQRSTWDSLRALFDTSGNLLEGCSAVTSSVVPIEDEGACQVVLRLELGELQSASKTNAIAGSVAFGGLILTVSAFAAIFGPLAWLPVGAGAAAAVTYGVTRSARSSYRKAAAHLEENVEGYLDKLEHDPESVEPAQPRLPGRS